MPEPLQRSCRTGGFSPVPGTFGYKVLQTSVIFPFAVGVLGFVRHNVSGFKSVALCRAQDASFIRARAFTALQLTPKVSVPSRGLTKKVKIAVCILKQDTASSARLLNRLLLPLGSRNAVRTSRDTKEDSDCPHSISVILSK